MQVIVNSDHHITGDETVTARVESILADSIERFADRITKVEAFLSDTNSSKHGARDKRCVLEARVAGVAPVVASNEAPTVLEAIEGAADKLERALEHAFGKLDASAGKSPREQDVAQADELGELEKWERERESRQSKHTR
ncbi:MAG TPA: HPF/RaiA family ribosome-associated protein [Steroidobacteraceae bacterium]